MNRSYCGCLLTLSLWLGLATPTRAEDLLRFQGKTLEAKDLNPAEQQTLHEIELERYLKLSALVDDAIFDRYLDARAKKEGKSRDALEALVLTVPEVSDKDAKAWFDDNQGRLPPQLTFDQVKG